MINNHRRRAQHGNNQQQQQQLQIDSNIPVGPARVEIRQPPKVWDVYTPGYGKLPDSALIQQVTAVFIPRSDFLAHPMNWSDLKPDTHSAIAVKVLSHMLDTYCIGGTNYTNQTGHVDPFSCGPNKPKFFLVCEVVVRDNAEKNVIQDENVLGYRLWLFSQDQTVDYLAMLNTMATTPAFLGKDTTIRLGGHEILDYFSKAYCEVGNLQEERSYYTKIFSPDKMFGRGCHPESCLVQRISGSYFQDNAPATAASLLKTFPVRQATFAISVEHAHQLQSIALPTPTVVGLIEKNDEVLRLVEERSSLEMQMQLDLFGAGRSEVEMELRCINDKIKELSDEINIELDYIKNGGEIERNKKALDTEELLAKYFTQIELRKKNLAIKEELEKNHGSNIPRFELLFRDAKLKMLETFGRRINQGGVGWTDTIKSMHKKLNGWKMDVKVDSTCPENLTLFGSMIARMMNDITSHCLIETNQVLVLLTWVSGIDSYRLKIIDTEENLPGFATNVLFNGPAGAGKSEVLDQVARMFLPGSTEVYTHFSTQAFNSKNVHSNSDKFHLLHETTPELMGISDNLGKSIETQKSTLFKAILTKALSVAIRYDPETGDQSKSISINAGGWACLANWALLKNNSGSADRFNKYPQGEVDPSFGKTRGAFTTQIQADKTVKEAKDTFEKFYHPWHALIIATQKAIEAGILADVDLTVAKILCRNIIDKMNKKYKAPGFRANQQLYIMCRSLTLAYATYKNFFSAEARAFSIPDDQETFDYTLLLELEQDLKVTTEIAAFAVSLVYKSMYSSVEADVCEVILKTLGRWPPREEGDDKVKFQTDMHGNPNKVAYVSYPCNPRNLPSIIASSLGNKYSQEEIESALYNLERNRTVLGHRHEWKLSHKNRKILEDMVFSEKLRIQIEKDENSKEVHVYKWTCTSLDQALNDLDADLHEDNRIISEDTEDYLAQSIGNMSVDAQTDDTRTKDTHEAEDMRCNICKNTHKTDSRHECPKCTECNKVAREKSLIKCKDCGYNVHKRTSSACRKVCYSCKLTVHRKCALDCAECGISLCLPCFQNHLDFLPSPSNEHSKVSPVITYTRRGPNKPESVDICASVDTSKPSHYIKEALDISHKYVPEPWNMIVAIPPERIYTNEEGDKKLSTFWSLLETIPIRGGDDAYIETHSIDQETGRFETKKKPIVMYHRNMEVVPSTERVYSQSITGIDKDTRGTWAESTGGAVKTDLDRMMCAMRAISIGITGDEEKVAMSDPLTLKKYIFWERCKREGKNPERGVLLENAVVRYPEDHINERIELQKKYESEQKLLREDKIEELPNIGKLLAVEYMARRFSKSGGVASEKRQLAETEHGALLTRLEARWGHNAPLLLQAKRGKMEE